MKDTTEKTKTDLEQVSDALALQLKEIQDTIALKNKEQVDRLIETVQTQLKGQNKSI
jgi:hypothetical protein